MSPNPICHPSSLWIYSFAEYRKSTRQVKGVVLYTLQLQKWREQWWLITTVCEWGKEKLQIWSWVSLSTFKWWLNKYSCSRTTGPVFGIERGNSPMRACQKQLFSHNLLFSRSITRLFCVRQSWRTLECWAALIGCWIENDNMSEKLSFFQTHWIDMRIGNTVGLGCGYKTGNGFNLLNSNIGQWQKNYLCGPKPNRIALHCIYE